MSIPSRSPLRMLGAVPNSGFPNTGEVRMTRGGEACKSYYSGIGVDALVIAGAGRLNTVTRLSSASGSAVIFYDAATAVSGGVGTNPVLHIILQPVPVPLTGSGTYGVSWPPFGVPYAVDMPFSSGLVVAPVGSGTCQFNFTYTAETNPSSGGSYN